MLKIALSSMDQGEQGLGTVDSVPGTTNDELHRRQLGRGLLDHSRRVGDQLEQHPRGLGRAARALLPLPQRRQRHPEAPGETGLRQAEPAPQPGDAERVARPFRREPAHQLRMFSRRAETFCLSRPPGDPLWGYDGIWVTA